MSIENYSVHFAISCIFLTILLGSIFSALTNQKENMCVCSGISGQVRRDRDKLDRPYP